MLFLACGGAGVLHNDDLVVTIVRIARGRLNCPCRADAGKGEAFDLVSSKQWFQISAVEGADSRLDHDDIGEIGFQIGVKFGALSPKFERAGLIGVAEEGRMALSHYQIEHVTNLLAC